MSPERLAEIEARLKAATPGPWSYDDGVTDDTTTPPEKGKPNAIYDRGAGWIASPAGDSAIDDANGRLIANAPADLADLLAEVRRLTAERATALEAISDAGDYVEGDSLIDSINELITDTDEIRRQGRRENEAGDIVGEIRPMLGGVDQEGVIRAVAEVVDERDALRARVAELEEAARWRPLGPGPVAS